MALKDLSSLYDLVGGNQPVGDMENQQGGTPFDLGPDSTLQQNSLPEIPVNSPYQDLDAVDGGNGYFHNIPNPGKFQGKQVGGVDLHEHLLTNPYNYTYGNSSQFYNNTENVGPSPGQTGNSEYQDLDGIDGGNGFFHGVDQRPTLQGKKIFKNDDLHISLLKNQNYGYSYGITTLGNQPGQAGPYLDPSIDLNGGLPSTGKYEDNMPS